MAGARPGHPPRCDGAAGGVGGWARAHRRRPAGRLHVADPSRATCATAPVASIEALLYAEALASPEPLDLQAAQLPHRAGDRWVALPATPDHPIQGGRLSLVIQASGQTRGRRARRCAASSSTSGPRWCQRPTQVTGVALPLRSAQLAAPQALLLAVPPAEEGVWSLDALEAVVARDDRSGPAPAGRSRGARPLGRRRRSCRARGTTCRRSTWR